MIPSMAAHVTMRPRTLPMFLRHLLAIAILPFTVTVLVPWWIARDRELDLVPDTPLGFLIQLAGFMFLAVGFVLFVASLRQFIVQGRGTLAPWDPPRNLVVQGPYRYVRNPMISGVLFVVSGEAMILRSWPHALWAVIFWAANMVFIPFFEEPQLRDRFGLSYREYCRHVRRFIPRLRPWNPAAPHPCYDSPSDGGKN
jgi:protein-S-isoprenylcysteine O-methyltransferase Ste14